MAARPEAARPARFLTRPAADVTPEADARRASRPYRGVVFRPMLRAQVITDVVVAVVLGALVMVASGARTGLAARPADRRRHDRRVANPSPLAGAGTRHRLGVRRLRDGDRADPDLSNVFIAAVMYTTSAYGSRRVRTAGLVSAIGGSLVAAGYLGWQDYQMRLGIQTASGPELESLRVTVAYFAGILLLLLLPWLGGLVRRVRRSASMSREAQLVAERDAARADRAVAVEQERVRIARDMHDIVAHSLAVVIAQADGARYALKADPAIADEALGTISTTARRALGDVRELLGALRHEQGTAPTPEIDDIERLVGEMREVGLDVRVEREGDPEGLPTSTQLAVYRIVQESLTNAWKHGEPVLRCTQRSPTGRTRWRSPW